MRRKQLKKELKRISGKPDDRKKAAFLDHIYESDMSASSFVKAQIPFIKAYVWFMSGFLFILLCIGIGNARCQWQAWPVSAMMPFGVLIVTSEMNRAERYRMQEFELVTYFSAKAALMARIFIIGLVQMIILLILIPAACIKTDMSLYQAALYMLCPYCLSAYLNLRALCKVHGENANYICVALSAGVSVLFVMFTNLAKVIQAADSGCFLLFSVVFMVLTMVEGKKYVKQMEELAWN